MKEKIHPLPQISYCNFDHTCKITQEDLINVKKPARKN